MIREVHHGWNPFPSGKLHRYPWSGPRRGAGVAKSSGRESFFRDFPHGNEYLAYGDPLEAPWG